jgi:hypothetical protein
MKSWRTAGMIFPRAGVKNRHSAENNAFEPTSHGFNQDMRAPHPRHRSCRPAQSDLTCILQGFVHDICILTRIGHSFSREQFHDPADGEAALDAGYPALIQSDINHLP